MSIDVGNTTKALAISPNKKLIMVGGRDSKYSLELKFSPQGFAGRIG